MACGVAFDGSVATGGGGPEGGAPGSGGTTSSDTGGGPGGNGGAGGTGGAGGGGAEGGGALGPFDPPTAVAALNSADADDDPTLTGDLLEIYFDSNRAGGMGMGDIWYATRPTASDPWGTPQPVVGINTANGETTPEVAKDGLTLWWSTNDSGNFELRVAVRSQRQDPWSAPVTVAELNSVEDDFAPSVTSDLLHVVFGSMRPGAGDHDLWSAARPSAGSPWDPPVLLSELVTASVEADPWLSSTRLELWFATDRAGGAGAWDIWCATRVAVDQPWGTPTPVSELNSAATDSDVWLSPDGKTAYFSSDRDGDTDLFVATR